MSTETPPPDPTDPTEPTVPVTQPKDGPDNWHAGGTTDAAANAEDLLAVGPATPIKPLQPGQPGPDNWHPGSEPTTTI